MITFILTRTARLAE